MKKIKDQKVIKKCSTQIDYSGLMADIQRFFLKGFS